MKISTAQHESHLKEKARLESIGFEFEVGHLGYTVKRNGDWVHGYSEVSVPPRNFWEGKRRKYLVFALAVAQDEEVNNKCKDCKVYKRPISPIKKSYDGGNEIKYPVDTVIELNKL